MALHFASDLHLGAPDAEASRDRERAFLKWIEEVGSQGDGLHLVGDLIDFWFEWRHVVPKGGVRLLGCIADLVDGGLDVHWHLGNHDMWSYDEVVGDLTPTPEGDSLFASLFAPTFASIARSAGSPAGSDRVRFLPWAGVENAVNC